jgi:hypothetical protein
VKLATIRIGDGSSSCPMCSNLRRLPSVLKPDRRLAAMVYAPAVADRDRPPRARTRDRSQRLLHRLPPRGPNVRRTRLSSRSPANRAHAARPDQNATSSTEERSHATDRDLVHHASRPAFDQLPGVPQSVTNAVRPAQNDGSIAAQQRQCRDRTSVLPDTTWRARLSLRPQRVQEGADGPRGR